MTAGTADGQRRPSADNRIAVLSIGSALLATLPSVLADGDALSLQEDLSDQILRKGARQVVLDLSAVPTIDSFMAAVLARTADVCRLLSAEATVVGMRPEVAITMVEMGLALPGLRTARTLDAALAFYRGHEA